MARVSTIEAVLALDARQWNKTLDQSVKRLKKMAGDSRAVAAATGAFLAGASVGLLKFAGSLEDAGQEALELKATLDATFDGAQLDQFTDQVRSLGASGLFNEDQFASAAKTLATFSDNSAEVTADLVRIGNVSASTGGSFETLSKAFATFGIKEEASNQLLEIANISPGKLERFGAVIDEASGKLDFTGANAEKARQALRKLADAEFAGKMDEATTSTDRLNGELKLLQQDAGGSLAQLSEDAAGFVLPLVQGIRDLPGPTKAAAGATAALAGALGLAASAGIGLVLAWPAIAAGATAVLGAASTLGFYLSVGFTASVLAAEATLAALGGAFALVALPLAAASAGLYAYTNALETANKASKDLLKVELARAANQRELSSLQGKTAAQLLKEGKTSKDALNGILALQERIEVANKAGNEALVDRLKGEVAQLQQIKKELAEGEKKLRDEAKADAIASTPKARAEAKKAREEAAKESEKQRKEADAKAEADRQAALSKELDGIALKLAQEKISESQSLALRKKALEEFRASEQEKRALAIETATFRVNAANKAEEDSSKDVEAKRQAKLDKELARIDLLKAQQKLSASEEVKALDRVLSTFALTEDEKQRLSIETANLKKKLSDQSVKEADAAAKKQQAQAQALERAESEGRDLQRDALSGQIDKLQKETDETGKDNSSKIKAAIQQSLELQVESIRKEAELAKAATDSAKVKEQVEVNAQLKIKAARADAAESEKAATEDQIESIKKLRAERNKDESTFSGDPFGIEDLNKSINEDLNSQRRFSGTLPEFSTLATEAAQVSQLSPQAQAQAQVQAQAAQEPVEFKGSLEIALSGLPEGAKADVKRTGLDGRFSDIEISMRGMKGGSSFA